MHSVKKYNHPILTTAISTTVFGKYGLLASVVVSTVDYLSHQNFFLEKDTLSFLNFSEDFLFTDILLTHAIEYSSFSSLSGLMKYFGTHLTILGTLYDIAANLDPKLKLLLLALNTIGVSTIILKNGALFSAKSSIEKNEFAKDLAYQFADSKHLDLYMKREVLFDAAKTLALYKTSELISFFAVEASQIFSVITKGMSGKFKDFITALVKVNILQTITNPFFRVLDVFREEFQNEIKEELQDNVSSFLLEQDNIYKIYNNYNSDLSQREMKLGGKVAMIVTYIQEHIFNSLNSVHSRVLSDLLQKLSAIYVLGPNIDIALLPALFSRISNVLEYLKQSHNMAQDEYIEASKNKKNLFLNDFGSNIELILQLQGVEFSQKLLNSGLKEERKVGFNHDFQRSFYQIIEEALEDLINGLVQIIRGYKLFAGQIGVKQLYLITNNKDQMVLKALKDSNQDIYWMESWNYKVMKSFSEMISATEFQPDGIQYHWNKELAENSIVIKDTHIFLKGDVLLDIDDFTFKVGKAYAMTGKTGSGKTTLMSALMGGVHKDITISGSIFFADGKEDIILLPQRDYILNDMTLLQLVMYPQYMPHDELMTRYYSRVYELMQEIQIDEGAIVSSPSSKVNNLDVIDDWGSKLSGGQPKKIAVLSAIMRQPKVLIMDETFRGLDEESLCIVQYMLKKYLPKTLMIVIDHEAKHHNNNDFFESLIHLSDTHLSIHEPPESISYNCIMKDTRVCPLDEEQYLMQEFQCPIEFFYEI